MNTSPNLLGNKFNSPSISGQSPFQQRRYLDICNISIFESKRLDSCEFTNFFPSRASELKSILADLLKYLEGCFYNKDTNILSFKLDENINFSSDLNLKNKIESIIKLYNSDSERIDINQIGKAKIVSNFYKDSTSFRIYLSITPERYSIILLDPLHFVIPSKVQRQKENGFQTHKGNNLCMYNHIILRDTNMKRSYDTILYAINLKIIYSLLLVYWGIQL